MNVICLDNCYGMNYLTIGKKYKLLGIEYDHLNGDELYVIMNDLNIKRIYESKYFKMMTRLDKLNRILD